MELAEEVAASIDRFNKSVRPVTVAEILNALEVVRHAITEEFLEASR